MLPFSSRTISIRTNRMAIKSICKLLKSDTKNSFARSTKTISIINIGKYEFVCDFGLPPLFNCNIWVLFNTLDSLGYSDALKRNYLLGRYYLEVEMEDVAGFDETLSDKIYKQPTENLQIFEEAAREVADEITSPRPEGEEDVEDIQVLLQSNGNPINIRELKVCCVFVASSFFIARVVHKLSLEFNRFDCVSNLQSECVSRLVKVAGIIIAASGIKAKATSMSIQCRSCNEIIPNLKVNPGLEGFAMPRKCTT